MRFWDTSAVMPLLFREAPTPRVRELLERDEEMAVWWSTWVECCSAIEQARRTRRFEASELALSHQRLDIFRSVWFELSPADEIRRQASRLLRVHPLRAADALQLGSALVWSARYDNAEFVSFDARLREAARLEGLAVTP